MLPAQQQPNMVPAQHQPNMVPAQQQPNMVPAQQQPNMVPAQQPNLAQSQSRTVTPPLAASLSNSGPRVPLPMPPQGGQPLVGRLPQAAGGPLTVVGSAMGGASGAAARLIVLQMINASSKIPNPQVQHLQQVMASSMQLLSRTPGGNAALGSAAGLTPPAAMGPPPPSRRDPKK